MSLHEKGDQTRALNHNSDFSVRFRVDFPNSQTFANFTSEICRRGLLSFRESRAVSSAFRIGTDERNPHLCTVFLSHSLVRTIGCVLSSFNSKRCAAPPKRGRLHAVFFWRASRSRFQELTFTQTVFPNSIPRGSSGILTDSRTYVDTVAYFAVANCLRNKCLAFPVDGQGHLAIDARAL